MNITSARYKTTDRREFAAMLCRVNMGLLGHCFIYEAQLMAGTALTEGRLLLRVQEGGGPARGLFQVEPETALDLYRNFVNDPRINAGACSYAPRQFGRIDQPLQLQHAPRMAG